MSARSIWKGVLKIGTVKLPVKLYSAVQDHTVRFNVLEKRTMTPIKQHMVDPETDREVPREEIRKGYAVEKGTFVLLDDQELEQFEPKASREVDVIDFVLPQILDHRWYDRPYYLGPDGDTKTYFALADALAGKGKIGIARWVMRGKQYIGALTANDSYLTLITLRYAEEVLSPEEITVPKGKAISPGELKMAEQLVDVLRGEFRPDEFQDDYRDRLMKFIETKGRGRKPRLHAVRSKQAATTDLMDKLTKSLKAAQKEKKVA